MLCCLSTPTFKNIHDALIRNHKSWNKSHTWNKQMASLMYVSNHESSSYLCAYRPCHIWNQDMTSLLWGTAHAFSNNHFLLMKCHTCGFPHVWVHSWVFKLALCFKPWSHLEQANGLPPVWVISCFFKCPFSEIELSHLEQANGLPHVWVQSWVFKLSLCL